MSSSQGLHNLHRGFAGTTHERCLQVDSWTNIGDFIFTAKNLADGQTTGPATESPIEYCRSQG